MKWSLQTNGQWRVTFRIKCVIFKTLKYCIFGENIDNKYFLMIDIADLICVNVTPHHTAPKISSASMYVGLLDTIVVVD